MLKPHPGLGGPWMPGEAARGETLGGAASLGVSEDVNLDGSREPLVNFILRP